jgi:hypothetical protein
MINAISFEIYKSRHDCTNNGISSRFSDGYIAVHDGNLKFEDDELPENLFYIEKRFLFGEFHYNLKPYISMSNGKHYMFGGNLGYSSDSRFGGNPLKIHDRTE